MCVPAWPPASVPGSVPTWLCTTTKAIRSAGSLCRPTATVPSAALPSSAVPCRAVSAAHEAGWKPSIDRGRLAALAQETLTVLLGPATDVGESLEHQDSADVGAPRGLVTGVRRATNTPPMRGGRRVVFVSLDDGTGPVANVVFFHDARERLRRRMFPARARSNAPFRGQGRLRHRRGPLESARGGEPHPGLAGSALRLRESSIPGPGPMLIRDLLSTSCWPRSEPRRRTGCRTRP